MKRVNEYNWIICIMYNDGRDPRYELRCSYTFANMRNALKFWRAQKGVFSVRAFREFTNV